MSKTLVNGKHYPFYQQFVDRKDEWIGGLLMEETSGLPTGMVEEGGSTTIEDILLEPNGETSAVFRVQGETFDCAFDVQYGGACGGQDGWLEFSGYGGHHWKIKKKQL